MRADWDRRRRVLALWRSGLSMADIGRKESISRERVRQILNHLGVRHDGRRTAPAPVWLNAHNAARAPLLARDRAAIAADYRAGRPVREVAEAHDVSVRTVYYALDLTGTPRRDPRKGPPRGPRPRTTEDAGG